MLTPKPLCHILMCVVIFYFFLCFPLFHLTTSHGSLNPSGFLCGSQYSQTRTNIFIHSLCCAQRFWHQSNIVVLFSSARFVYCSFVLWLQYSAYTITEVGGGCFHFPALFDQALVILRVLFSFHKATKELAPQLLCFSFT